MLVFYYYYLYYSFNISNIYKNIFSSERKENNTINYVCSIIYIEEYLDWSNNKYYETST